MPATTVAKASVPVKSISPNKEPAKPPPTSLPSPHAPPRGGSAAGGTSTPTNATAKGSRRAQGWHSAVGGGGGGNSAGAALPPAGTTATASGIRETQSNLDAKGLTNSRANSGMPRRPSVQFSEDAFDGHAGPHPTSTKPRPPPNAANAKDDVAFRQSMADFLTVMYGDRSSAGGAGKGGARDKTDAGGSPLAKRQGRDEGGAAGKDGAASAQRSSSPRAPPAGSKGPLVKGLTASGHRHPQGDRIDTLVDTLVRAYSRQTTSSRGDFHGMTGPDDDNPITYSRPRQSNYRRAVASPRLARGGGGGSGHGGAAGENEEVSLFVSQAIDSFIGPGGLRQQGLASNRSMLSSLGVDRNMFDLMSFHTHSNMQDVDAVEDESGTKLEPMYVGEQAMFRSVGTRPNMNDVSVSKSMRGVIPSPSMLAEEDAHRSSSGGGGGGGASDTQRRLSGSTNARRTSGGAGSGRAQPMNGSDLSLDSGEAANGKGALRGSSAKRRAPARRSSGGNNNKSITRCMSLDSKAFGNDGEEDDSWGDTGEAVGTAAAATAAAAPSASASQAAKNTAGGPAVVSSARSLLDYSKTRRTAAAEAGLLDLQDEERLKREVVMAVERQLRGYITSLEPEERAKRARKGSGEGGSSSGRAPGATAKAPAARVPAGTRGHQSAPTSAGTKGADAKPTGRAAVSSDASPLMKNVLDFFEESTKPTAGAAKTAVKRT